MTSKEFLELLDGAKASASSMHSSLNNIMCCIVEMSTECERLRAENAALKRRLDEIEVAEKRPEDTEDGLTPMVWGRPFKRPQKWDADEADELDEG